MGCAGAGLNTVEWKLGVISLYLPLFYMDQ